MTSSNTRSSCFTLQWIAMCVTLMLSLQGWAHGDNKKSSSSSPAPASHPAQPVQHTGQPAQHPSSGQQRPAGNVAHPVGTAPAHPGGTTGTYAKTAPGGSTAVSRPPSSVTSPHSGQYQPTPRDQAKALPGGYKEYSQPGHTVRTDSTGQVRHIEAQQGIAGPKMVINRTPGSGREVISGRPGSRVVSWGPNRGFVERPVRPGYISRTYVYGGRSSVAVYRQGYYRGYGYYRYVPNYYYGPRFYGWAATPWATPVPYYWGGPVAAPWFGFYAAYFTPYAVYPSPDLWLTDYLISQNLRAAYENGRASGEAEPSAQVTASSTPTVTPEMKAMIADEVRQQLAAEQAAAAQPSSSNAGPASDQAPPALTQKFFVVASNLDVTANGQPCTLTAGDIIERRGKDAGSDGNVAVEVVSSKKGDCPADSSAPVQVQLADLQEMHNQFRQHLDSGLKVLADGQAKGIPAAPAANKREVPEGTASPAPDAESTLLAQDKEAEKLQARVLQN